MCSSKLFREQNWKPGLQYAMLAPVLVFTDELVLYSNVTLYESPFTVHYPVTTLVDVTTMKLKDRILLTAWIHYRLGITLRVDREYESRSDVELHSSSTWYAFITEQ